MRRLLATTFAALLVLAACGSDDDEPVQADDPDPTATDDPPADGDAPLYRGTGMVLESGSSGPDLCFSSMDSYPPQCGGGVPLVGWDWSEATGHESASGTRWGSYEVTGHWDGESLTVVSIGEPSPDGAGWPSDDADRLDIPCDEPDGGWVVPSDTPRPETEDNEALHEYINAQPEYSASWVNHSQDPSYDPDNLEEYQQDPAAVVTVVRFSEDAERHEAAMRELWGGPLCVIEGGVPQAELERIRIEVDEKVEFLSSGLDLVGGRIEYSVDVVDPELQEELDREYGEGVVVLHGNLQPVD